jgi:hypothetical protein
MSDERAFAGCGNRDVADHLVFASGGDRLTGERDGCSRDKERRELKCAAA